MDTQCSLCTTLVVSNPAVVFASGNLDRSLVTSSENEQCLASCSPGYFEWLRSEQPDIGSVYNPLCFACTSTICGSMDGISGSTRSRVGLQYTSTCTNTQDSKCESCDEDIVGLDATILVSNGQDIGSFCTYQCAPGSYICEKCQFHGLDDQMCNESRHTLLLDVNHTTTETWKSDSGSVVLYSMDVQGIDPTNFNNAYRFSGNVMFLTWPYATEMKICMTIEEPTVGFVMEPSVGDVCALVLKPYVSPSRNPHNQSFSVDVELFHVFQNLTSIANYSGGPVIDSRLKLMWRLSTSPNASSVTIWNLKFERYEMLENCCAVPYSCVHCDESTKVVNSHFVQSGFMSSSELISIASQCTWECDTHYEDYMNNATCLYCKTPDCNVDEYFEDCGKCGKCVNPPSHATWNVSGNVRGDNNSCVFICDPMYYETRNENGDVICRACDQMNCSIGYEYSLECNAYQNALCVSCSICGPGLYENSSCTLEQDRTCNHCEVQLPNGGFWVRQCEFECFAPLIHNTLTSTCMLCEPHCPIGKYSLSICDITTNFTGCRVCTIPGNATAISSGILYDFTCDWECPSSYYYDITTEACVEFIPVIQEPTHVCNSSACLHMWGHYQDSVSCECIACSQQRGNASQVGISSWEAQGTCSWFCLFPFMRQDDLCFRIDNLSVDKTKNKKKIQTKSPTNATSTSAVVILSVSVIPLFLMILLVSFKIAL